MKAEVELAAEEGSEESLQWLGVLLP